MVGDFLVCCLTLSFGGSGSGLGFVFVLVVVDCDWFGGVFRFSDFVVNSVVLVTYSCWYIIWWVVSWFCAY